MSEKNISSSLDSNEGQSPDFRRTQWSLVRRAGGPGSPEAREALGTLAPAYWFPIYAFVRRQGQPSSDAISPPPGFFARLPANPPLPPDAPRLGKSRTLLC